MNYLNILYKYNLNGKVRNKHEWKYVLESTCFVTSLHLVQAGMVKTCPKKVNKKKYFFVHYKQGSITHSFNVKKFYNLHPFKNLHVF